MDKAKYIIQGLYKNGEEVSYWKTQSKNRSTTEHRFKIGEITINNETIIETWRGSKRKDDVNYKYYTLRCNDCGAIYARVESNMLKKNTCPCCCPSPQFCYSNTNSISTTSSWMTDLLLNKEDSYKYTKGSNVKLLWKCHCGEIIEKTPKDVLKIHSLGCTVCGDGLSYAEKLLGNILRRLHVKYEKCTTEWSEGKEYDFFLKREDIIFEVHGKQHYEENGFHKLGGRLLKDEQENDKLKRELAFANGVKHYYEIDCRESTLNYCRPNMEEALKNHFDLSLLTDEVWCEADVQTLTSTMIKCCNLANDSKYNVDGGIDVSGIAKELNISSKTVRVYLERGNENGLCKYDGRLNAKLNAKVHLTGKGVYYIGVNSSGEVVCRLKRNEFKSISYYKMVHKVSARENNVYDNLFWFKEEDYLNHVENATLSLQAKKRVAHNKGKKLVNGTYIELNDKENTEVTQETKAS